MNPSSPRQSLLRCVTAVLLGSWLAGCGGDGDSLIPPPDAGTGTPSISVSPQSVTFAFDTPDVETLFIANGGPATLILGTLSLQGADAAAFALMLDNCSGARLAAGASCQVDVALPPPATPSTVERIATLRIPSNDTAVGDLDVPLAGGRIARLASTPASVAFGTVATRSAAIISVEVRNSGNVDVTIDPLGAVGGTDAAEFAVLTNDCDGATLTPGLGCTLGVQFAPLTAGDKTAGLAVASADLAADLVIPLTGTGRLVSFVTDLATVDFGDVPVGLSSSLQTVTVENTSAASITLVGVSLTGLDSGQFTIDTSSTCTGATLASTETCVVVVSFSPTAVGDKVTTLNLETADDTVTVALSGRGLGAEILVDPVFLDFRQVSVGTTSTAVINVSNTGNDVLPVGQVTVDPAAGDFFIQSDLCAGQLVAAGAAPCQITVGFSPGSIGSQEANLEIASDAVNDPTVVIPLRGFGLTALALNPPNAPFGSLTIPATDSTTFTLLNTTTAAITVDSLNVVGTDVADFTLSADTCSGLTLGAGVSCTADVQFAPATPGAKAAELLVTSIGSGISLRAALSGTALAPQPTLQATPGRAEFGEQLVGTASAPTSIAVSNLGGGDLVIGTISLDGTAPFAIDVDGCTGQVLTSADPACLVEVVFAPTEFGDASGLLEIPSNDPSQQPSQQLPLTGFGVSPVRVSPRTLGFGPVSLGLTSAPMLVTLTNDGTATVSLGVLLLTSGDQYALSNDTCGASLLAATSCTAEVWFQPGLLGTLTDTLTISTSASPDIEVALSGFGQRAVSVSPTALNFGNVVVGAVPAPSQLITVTNVGSDAAAIGTITFSAGDFTLQNDTCSNVQLPAAATCTFEVVFPPATPGLQDADMRLTANGFETIVPVRGNGF